MCTTSVPFYRLCHHISCGMSISVVENVYNQSKGLWLVDQIKLKIFKQGAFPFQGDANVVLWDIHPFVLDEER